MKLLVFSDNDEVAKEILSGVRPFKERAFVLTYSSESFEGFADKVLRCSISSNIRFEDHAVAAIENVAKMENFDLILVGATKRGKEIAPRVAQRLGYPCVTDVTKIDVGESIVVERMCFSGKTIATIRLSRLPAVISVMPKVFEIEEGNEIPEESQVSVDVSENTKVIEVIEKEKSEVDLENARVVIGLGRGVGKRENVERLYELKEILEAEFGSTRPVAYDYSWLPEDTMIGFSGKKIKPELYIAVGISGQIQHMIGVMHAKRILAINKDENAPIFEYADYGIVSRWEEVIPKLVEVIKRNKKL
ncbi:Electron transfer flavoprotein alpha subunit [Ferroglobus placidus DSM 10642]|uniref:Electron transfer flavoprotein alpha subunit n=1 Tax=Ferroglobus placidus (strain DSM 10642 / AEDII12DO) TaxID=589924 RepID=D3S1H6_FERPA|nr:electron transfer flavoprotein subunit alpha/FixB family protein [Ferroglobus placidus]ADC66440.1 Electron transfer flavoprotein alpha subunit [Ferroglobus placidus DSM 10642]